MSIGKVIQQISISVAVTLPTLFGHESLRTVPYFDTAGNKTVCVGETKGVEDRVYTKSECLLLFAQRVSEDFEKPISKCTDSWTELPIAVRSASISLAYNIGTRAFCKSSARKEFDAGNWEIACDKFLLWNKVRINGVLTKSKGLVNRRAEERALCIEGLVASV